MPPLSRINKLESISHFAGFKQDPSASLKQVSLILADNATGKSTVASVLDSLAHKDADRMLAKRTLGGGTPMGV